MGSLADNRLVLGAWPVDRIPQHLQCSPEIWSKLPRDPWSYTLERIVEVLTRRWRAALAQHPRNFNKRHKYTAWLDAMSWANAFKAFSGCMYCGERDASCLDFHHRDAEDKIDSVSVLVGTGKGRAFVELEARKCDVVCANCHRKNHHRERYGLPLLDRSPLWIVPCG